MFDQPRPWKIYAFIGLAVATAAISYTISAKIKSASDARRHIDIMKSVVTEMEESVSLARVEVEPKSAAKLEEPAQKTVYRWTDKNGDWHLSDKAPENVKAEVIPLVPLNERPTR